MESTPDKDRMEHAERPEAISIAAALANDDEHSLTVREAFKRYPSAAFWAIAMSFTM